MQVAAIISHFMSSLKQCTPSNNFGFDYFIQVIAYSNRVKAFIS
jgi:hypothetical protein